MKMRKATKIILELDEKEYSWLKTHMAGPNKDCSPEDENPVNTEIRQAFYKTITDKEDLKGDYVYSERAFYP